MNEDKIDELPSYSKMEDEKRETSDVSERSDAESIGPVKRKKFPKSVFFIVGNEFCERFSYYGMRAVLTLYCTSQLGMSDNTATIIYHTFVMLCYFTPILGAWLADSWLGKFRTILYLSIIYACGNVVLSGGSMFDARTPMIVLSMIGLVLIALGTGGIKPCVSAFGGDQFDIDQLKARESFFFIFYFSINAGSLISTFITPLLREDVQCFGEDTCFPLAFGLPAALMVTSIIIFVCGKFMYRIIPPKENIVSKVSSCVWHALKRRNKIKEKRSHWLNYADDKYDQQFLDDVKAAFRVMYLYIPLPVFWALFEQQGSTWTIQATEMDGRLTDNYVILPDQMQVINPLFILLLIPVFNYGVYPLFAKCNLLTNKLTRMFIGGILAAIAFFIAAVVQLQIEKGLPVLPSSGTAEITYMNTMNCSLNIGSPSQTDGSAFNLNKLASSQIITVPVDVLDMQYYVNVTYTCDETDKFQPKQWPLVLSSEGAYTVVFSSYGNNAQMLQMDQSRKKPDDGNGVTRLAWAFGNDGDLILKSNHDDRYSFNPLQNTSDTNLFTFYSDYKSLVPDYYQLLLPNADGSTFTVPNLKLDIANGGVFTIAIQADDSYSHVDVVSYQEVKANKVKMVWQLPQYIIITIGEIMFSITGLEFSYSQAPVSMKSVLQAAWLITDAVGNLLIIILESIPMFDDESSMFFLYASLLVAVMLVFAWMCWGYEYVTIDSHGNVRYPGQNNNDETISIKSNDVKNYMEKEIVKDMVVNEMAKDIIEKKIESDIEDEVESLKDHK